MREQAGDAVLMPPVTTQLGGAAGVPVSGDVRLVPPVVGDPSAGDTRVEAKVPPIEMPAPTLESDLMPWAEKELEPATDAELAWLTAPAAPVMEPGPAADADGQISWDEPAAPAVEADQKPWDGALTTGEDKGEQAPWADDTAAHEPATPVTTSMPWEEPADEGTAEPAFEADVSETKATLAAMHASPDMDADFPLDAFIIPEDARRLPGGLPPAPTESAPTPVTDLADRLEKLSHRLRVEPTEALFAHLACGDKLDAMLAGLIAGLLAGDK